MILLFYHLFHPSTLCCGVFMRYLSCFRHLLHFYLFSFSWDWVAKVLYSDDLIPLFFFLPFAYTNIYPIPIIPFLHTLSFPFFAIIDTHQPIRTTNRGASAKVCLMSWWEQSIVKASSSMIISFFLWSMTYAGSFDSLLHQLQGEMQKHWKLLTFFIPCRLPSSLPAYLYRLSW